MMPKRTAKKGITPVLAVLLLLLITVTLTVLVYYWITSYFESIHTATTRETLRYGEGIHLDEYSTSVSGNTVTLTLYLRSKEEVKITHVYVKADDKVILSKSVSWTITNSVNAYTISFKYSGSIYEVILISKTGYKYAFIITVERG